MSWDAQVGHAGSKVNATGPRASRCLTAASVDSVQGAKGSPGRTAEGARTASQGLRGRRGTKGTWEKPATLEHQVKSFGFRLSSNNQV